MQYIEQQKSLHPHAMHQWKFIPEEWTVPAAKEITSCSSEKIKSDFAGI